MHKYAKFSKFSVLITLLISVFLSSCSQGDGRAMGAAMRVATELVLALIVGAAIGWFLDGWLGTRPWLLIIFFFLGFAAGLKNLFRTAAKTGGSQDANEED